MFGVSSGLLHVAMWRDILPGMELFDLNIKELVKLRKWYKRQPHKFRKATGSMLNDFAFGTRRSIVDLLTRRMTIRNPRFLSSRIRVTKARLSAPVNSQRALTGTMAGPRFSGFVEQEKGTPTERTRAATLAARSGAKSSQVKPRFRLKPSSSVVSMDDYGVDRLSAFVAMIFKRKEKRLIRIKGTIYKRKGKKLDLIQTLHPRHKQPRKRPFLQDARVNYFRSINLKSLWAKTIHKYLTPPNK